MFLASIAARRLRSDLMAARHPVLVCWVAHVLLTVPAGAFIKTALALPAHGSRVGFVASSRTPLFTLSASSAAGDVLIVGGGARYPRGLDAVRALLLGLRCLSYTF